MEIFYRALFQIKLAKIKVNILKARFLELLLRFLSFRC